MANFRHKQQTLTAKVEGILNANKDKRVVVVGTTCTGKSTLVHQLKEAGLKAHDMDELVFPRLSKEEAREVDGTPWTEEFGKRMEALSEKYVEVKAGEPVFGTVVFDSDLVIYLRITDDMLRARCLARRANFVDAKNMQSRIEEQIRKSGIPVIEITV